MSKNLNLKIYDFSLNKFSNLINDISTQTDMLKNNLKIRNTTLDKKFKNCFNCNNKSKVKNCNYCLFYFCKLCRIKIKINIICLNCKNLRILIKKNCEFLDKFNFIIKKKENLFKKFINLEINLININKEIKKNETKFYKINLNMENRKYEINEMVKTKKKSINVLNQIIEINLKNSKVTEDLIKYQIIMDKVLKLKELNNIKKINDLKAINISKVIIKLKMNIIKIITNIKFKIEENNNKKISNKIYCY